MSEIVEILIKRDGMSREEAEQALKECKEDFAERIEKGELPFDILEEYFGIEPDYIFELLD